MSIISSIAELFRRSAVPSVEATLGQGQTRERAIENLRALIGPGVEISNQVIGTALSRIQTALRRGEAIERGETVPRQFIPIDPTIPIGTEYRYRVQVTFEIPDPTDPTKVQTIQTVIPIDSETQLTRQQLNEMAQRAGDFISPREPSPKIWAVGEGLRTQSPMNFQSQVISVYRSPIG